MLLDGKLQETIDTEKLRLVRSDPNFIRQIDEYTANPVKDLDLTEEERESQKIPLYSLSEIYPDFRNMFKPLKRLRQEITLDALCGSVEQQSDVFYHGFEPIHPNDTTLLGLVSQIQKDEYKSSDQPLDVHAIPFRDKFEGFVQGGSLIVAAYKLAGKKTISANITFYKSTKKK